MSVELWVFIVGKLAAYTACMGPQNTNRNAAVNKHRVQNKGLTKYTKHRLDWGAA